MNAACFAVAAAVLSGCAHDVHTRLIAAPDEPTGSITIVLTQPARDLTVSVNGQLVAERAHTQKVTVKSVPVGMADVVIAAGGGAERVERHVRVEIAEGVDSAIPVGAPHKSMSAAMSMGALSVTAWLLSRAIVLAFL